MSKSPIAIGSVAVGEASVVIAVSSDHRNDAFLACRFIIDELKEQVPIWKQEVWAGWHDVEGRARTLTK